MRRLVAGNWGEPVGVGAEELGVASVGTGKGVLKPAFVEPNGGSNGVIGKSESLKVAVPEGDGCGGTRGVGNGVSDGSSEDVANTDAGADVSPSMTGEGEGGVGGDGDGDGDGEVKGDEGIGVASGVGEGLSDSSPIGDLDAGPAEASPVSVGETGPPYV